MNMKPLILIVHAEPASRDALRTVLQGSGFDVAVLYEPGKVLLRLEKERPDLIVMACGADADIAFAVLNALRRRRDELPMIMLGERNDVTERVVALDSGADDFVSKPFHVLEVLARIRRVLARVKAMHLREPDTRPPFHFRGFELNYTARALMFQGKPVPLSETDYAMLNLFTTAPGQVLSRETIARRVWPDVPHSLVGVGVGVHRLRRMLACRVAGEELIRTIRSRGYVFCPEPAGFAAGNGRRSREFALSAAGPA
ncbi:response regulator transcription factor [Trinickia terrae]|uniref:Response regulator transcription factor n=1 Tax=Trinickia terrae TaxID=2571161 RepID=A0A4U1I4W0_9BURK|nr:response regulator transcription factor [Trinickia terrae]TKC88295.1 response regulator transcription factor [Trinickia terrae]